MIKFINILILILFLSISVRADSNNEARDLYLKSIKTSDFDERVELRKKIVEISPNSEYGLFSRAFLNSIDCEYYENSVDCSIKTLDLYTDAIKINPKLTVAFVNRGVTYLRLGKHYLAIDDFSEAIRIDPKFLLSYTNRSYSYFVLKKYDLALKDCNEALKINPKFEQALFKRAELYNELEQYDNVIKDCTELLLIDPKCGPAYKLRAEAYKKLGLNAKAEKDEIMLERLK